MMCAWIVLLGILSAEGKPVPNLEAPPRTCLTGAQLTKQLRRDVSASWRNVPFRSVLKRLGDQYQISYLIDRGVNPDQLIDLDLNYQPLEAGLETIAKAGSAETRKLAHTIYVGTPERAAKLRTLEALRSEELLENANLPTKRKQELTRRGRVHWNDLAEPRIIVTSLCEDYTITLRNPEAIPHDLWASATLPELNFTEAMTLILVQFDLTFEWGENATEVRIIPLPKRVAVERAYRPAGGPSSRASDAAWSKFLQTAADGYAEKYPGVKGRVDVANRQVYLSGTLEQHEWLAGGNAPGNKPNPPTKFPPLSKRKFSLRVQKAPVLAIMKKLEESGVKFEYDAAALAAKKIRLDQTVTIDVQQADADEFFKAMFEPLGLSFKYDTYTVTLTPK